MKQDDEDVKKLLTAEGVLRLKNMFIENLDFKANDEDDVVLLNGFIETAKEVFYNFFMIFLF